MDRARIRIPETIGVAPAGAFKESRSGNCRSKNSKATPDRSTEPGWSGVAQQRVEDTSPESGFGSTETKAERTGDEAESTGEHNQSTGEHTALAEKQAESTGEH